MDEKLWKKVLAERQRAYYYRNIDHTRELARNRYYRMKEDPVRYRAYLDRINAYHKRRRDARKTQNKKLPTADTAESTTKSAET